MRNLSTVNNGVDIQALRTARVDQPVLKIVEKPTKIGVDSIELTRAEGPHDLCKTWTFKTFTEASCQIIENSFTAPKGGAYDRHDFQVTFADGFIYTGRFDVYHPSYFGEGVCIAQHIKELASWIINTDIEEYKKHKAASQMLLDTYDLETDTIGEDEVRKLCKPAIQEVENEQEQIRQAAMARHEEREELRAKGKEIAKQVIPADTKALIVAVHDNNTSELISGYHGHSTLATVVLGTSKHTRDIFSEMRKYADKIEETAHLKVKPIVNDRGEEKTLKNKDWWYPADEHREKYSMGGGYYLKDGHRHDTGWKICKKVLYDDHDWNESIYMGLAQRLVLG